MIESMFLNFLKSLLKSAKPPVKPFTENFLGGSFSSPVVFFSLASYFLMHSCSSSNYSLLVKGLLNLSSFTSGLKLFAISVTALLTFNLLILVKSSEVMNGPLEYLLSDVTYTLLGDTTIRPKKVLNAVTDVVIFPELHHCLPQLQH